MKFKYLVIILCALITLVTYNVIKKVILQNQTQGKKPYVVCTTTLISDALQHIAQDTIHLDVLMGPGVDPHTYKPIEKDLIKIARAHLVVYHGLHLEARMAELFEHLNSLKPTLAVTKNIEHRYLIKADDSDTIYDPHVWFNPDLWICTLTTICSTLCSMYPEHKILYQENTQRYIQEIQKAYHDCCKQTQKIPYKNRFLITSHDAFSYFGKAFNFNVVSLQGINTACEAGMCDVNNIVQMIIKHKIPTIFVESCIPPRNMQAIQQRVATHRHTVNIGPELYSDSLGNPDSPEGTYVGMLKYNVQTIVNGLHP
ncbi:zinc ABC transporter substrate-binding protein [Candidatus Babeliales bacterium]|nr:zinc ABC transporter substrate-binding protein [Candidatus Babeliales bacterium]